jgi:hypothetical protein
MTPQGERLAKVLSLASDPKVDVPYLMGAVAACVLEERIAIAKFLLRFEDDYSNGRWREGRLLLNGKNDRDTAMVDMILEGRHETGVR